MTTLLFFILLFLCVSYAGFSYWHSSEPPLLPVAEAGSTKESSQAFDGYEKTIRISRSDKMTVNGVALNRKEYMPLVVKGDCMEHYKDLHQGDVVAARLFDDKFTKKNIQPGDVLLIWLNDDRYKGYKLRVFGDYTADANRLSTYYFKGDERQNSSHPHHIESIKGVVKYKLSI